MIVETIIQVLILIIAAILTAFLSYYFGAKIYFKQKEYENIRKRYLEEGFDKLISEYEFALSAYRHNWLIGLSIIQQVRDLPRETVNIKLLDQIVSLKNNVLPTISVHRLNNIVCIDDIWKRHQALFSFVQSSYNTLTCDLYAGVLAYCNDQEKYNLRKDELFKEFFEKLQEFNSKSGKHDQYLGQIKNLSTIFERNVKSNKDMRGFRNWDEVRLIFKQISDSESP